MKQSQDLQVKMTIKILENILNKEQQQKEKERIVGVMRKYEKSREKREINGLNLIQGKMFMLFQDGFNCYKQSFFELAKTDKFKMVGETAGFDINDYLLGLQSNINIMKDAINVDNLVSKYTVNFLKLKKMYDSWPKELMSEWNSKAKEKMKKLQLKRQQKQKKKPEQPKQDKYSESDDNQSIQQKPRAAPQIIKPPEKEPERRISVDKPRGRVVDQRQDSRAESSRDIRNRLMERYLQNRQNRRDIHIQKGKTKEVAQFLASRLDHFMKKTIQKIVDVASLKNKKNVKFGNEVGYFNSANERITPQASLYYSANSKIYMMQYKHKLEIYTTLRSKQLKKEDELRNALEANTNETEKKVDKKIQNYMLKSRPKQVEPIQIFKQDKEIPKSNTSSLLVSAQHALYYLQNHRYLRNSLLLFNAYHY